jgi:serine/threonine protein kinase
MLLGQNNQVLLSDFGIATIAHTSRSLHTQDISGTIAYMAPEQVQGKSRPASDQYSLAIITYEWLTGYCPFRGTFAEIASQHMFAPLPPLQMSSQLVSLDVQCWVVYSVLRLSRQVEVLRGWQSGIYIHQPPHQL